MRRSRGMNVPERYECIVHQVIRDLFLEKKQAPTLDNILLKLKSLTVLDVIHHSLFKDQPVLDDDHKIWPWSRSTLHRYTQSIGFVYDDQRRVHILS